MGGLNKHVPMIVFLVGLALLIYSIRVFFNPKTARQMVAKSSPLVETGVRREAKPAPSVVFRPASKPSQPLPRLDTKEELQRSLRKVAHDHLKSNGLKMTVPLGYIFAEEADGPVQILVGANDLGRNDFFMFSVKGKYTADRAASYIKEYFDEVSIRGKPQPFYSRSPFKDLSQIRGTVGKVNEFQGYFFTNAKSNQSHLLVLLNKQYMKSSARVRELVDTIARASAEDL